MRESMTCLSRCETQGAVYHPPNASLICNLTISSPFFLLTLIRDRTHRYAALLRSRTHDQAGNA